MSDYSVNTYYFNRDLKQAADYFGVQFNSSASLDQKIKKANAFIRELSRKGDQESSLIARKLEDSLIKIRGKLDIEEAGERKSTGLKLVEEYEEEELNDDPANWKNDPDELDEDWDESEEYLDIQN